MTFNPKDLRRTKITIPLKQAMEMRPDEPLPVMIELNMSRLPEAKAWVMGFLPDLVTRSTERYVFARLTASQINSLVAADKDNSIHHVWPDFQIQA